jgi:hypothetical protein
LAAHAWPHGLAFLGRSLIGARFVALWIGGKPMRVRPSCCSAGARAARH